ncbi:MAG: ArnT family glycosyltransferase, partial [Candidatus Promineifilaceae bacterium]
MQLGDAPPGLYRDEAYNGLDALAVLAGDRQGDSPFYFAANNGREPLYIYLTAASVALFGRSPAAVRLPAGVIGALATVPVYLLARSWFGRPAGLLAAGLWAVTLWPVHLSRIGLRAILLPPVLALAFWLGTLAVRRGRDGAPAWGLWLAAGAVYGLSFYTYLAARFTPLLLLALALYLLATGRRRWLWPGGLAFLLAAGAVICPLALLAIQQPELVIGRAGQVSILNPDMRQGPLLSALAGNSLKAAGMFLVRGDAIVRHNPPGRPVFDLFMALPFLAGLVWCARAWRRPAASCRGSRAGSATTTAR